MKAAKLIYLSLAWVCALVIFQSCASNTQLGEKGQDPDQTGNEYAPDMYVSIPYEPYNQVKYNKFFADGRNAQKPVHGTVARGKLNYIYPYPQTNEGYEAAGRELKDPLPATPEVKAEGQQIFLKYCIHCHGEKGQGNGTIAAAGKIGVPSYADDAHKNLPEGKMFHTLTYGKNLMGSHASQLSPTERWTVIRYIQDFQHPDGAAATPAAMDSTKGARKPAANPKGKTAAAGKLTQKTTAIR